MTHLLASEVQQLLHNKFVVILGDSVQRAVYKDLVLLLQKDSLLTPSQLRAKGEMSFEQDTLMIGGQKGSMHSGIHYREVRQFCSDHHLVRFYFLTRVYSNYLEAVLTELQAGEHTPDVLIMNSCLWDISRYGQNSWKSYLHNLETLFERLGQVLPESCLLVWNTAMPVGSKIKASFLPRGGWPWAVPLKHCVIEANFYSSTKAVSHGFDVLDLHFHFRRAMGGLQTDGVHWNEHTHRQLSCLLLAHVADAWGVELPLRAPLDTLSQSGPAEEHPGRGVKRRRPAYYQDPGASPPPPPWPQPLLGSPPFPVPAFMPRPPPLLFQSPPPVPPYQRTPPFPLHPQGPYFSTDHIFQSDQFYLHSDIPSSTQPGFAFEMDFLFDPQPPMSGFPSPCYQQRAPVVYKGFPKCQVEGPYPPWRGQHPYMPRRGRPRQTNRRARAKAAVA
ncbi:PREDICTED: PC-esterase domain-containing protein 1B [Chinchilla lanigera]|uniref:PC-esterase domain containing 1B n=1 Tax=Chinchilla lanigera TaxID=34839 RepID=A0A8C2W7R7_CHILA|nr:PREDICTED: PC-esterase domain-containing protein 1B [Chinchilla lanigera]XP_013361160.1 PREDICTED: PC-esterase domain-containing protein 1B [Chinchilla lanigera]XP_013361161.1 PREDICTED: PC-esterase domain-containing protein 1B [Chinchilla lanigera]XP_013361162.1 PREDICTED: PC-esterase domain-containing protein 1B [Chinchilla lanigera]XP_013361163.1 PREDICTED: PC-esterase domain-containing protein 1B [Chinchilla lanigera]XP_013361164.1 PREDICTED: PC-esterase domain-containing protein 1B [Ch